MSIQAKYRVRCPLTTLRSRYVDQHASPHSGTSSWSKKDGPESLAPQLSMILLARFVAGVLIGSPGGQPPIEGRRSPECAPYGTLYAFLSQGVDVAIDDVPAVEDILEN